MPTARLGILRLYPLGGISGLSLPPFLSDGHARVGSRIGGERERGVERGLLRDSHPVLKAVSNVVHVVINWGGESMPTACKTSISN